MACLCALLATARATPTTAGSHQGITPVSTSEVTAPCMLQKRLTSVPSLSYGVMHRLPRVSPDEPIRYHRYVIPKGVRRLRDSAVYCSDEQ
jgi:hypothetical protein